MTTYNPVLWQEGMFLTPQHFQQEFRHITHQINMKPTALGNFAWGIKSFSFNQELLALGKISIEECVGLFSDGTFFSAPFTDDLPPVIEITRQKMPCLLYLAVPVKPSYSEKRPDDSIHEESAIPRFIPNNMEILDHCQDLHNIATITVSKLNLKLLLESDDHNGFFTIPIAQIQEVASSGQIILNENFVPTCLTINASPKLSKHTHEIITGLLTRADSLSQIIGDDAGYSETAKYTDYMILQIYNRYQLLLSHFFSTESCHPELLYRTLLQLIGELSTFGTKSHRVKMVQPYLHQDLTLTFNEIFKTISSLLSQISRLKAVSCVFEIDNAGIWTSHITDPTLFNNADFILVLKPFSRDINLELEKEFPKQIKIASPQKIRTLINHGLPGTPIQHLIQPPRQVPYYLGGLYFNLDISNENWKDIIDANSLSIHLSGKASKYEFELWAIRQKER